MSIQTYIPSMFVRRLLLLGVLVAAGFFVLTVQLGRLTLVEGATHRQAAERHLVRERWLPARRGQILDRNRVLLAKDRAAFNIAFDYSVIDGSWSRETAQTLARDQFRGEWSELSDSEREAIWLPYVAPLDDHLRAMWTQLARLCGVTPAEINEEKQAVIRRVTGALDHYVDLRAAQQEKEQTERGKIVSDAERERIRQRLRRSGIQEQNWSHVIVPNVPVETGFEFLRRMDERIVMRLVEGGAEHEIDRFPGIDVQHTGDREYPQETRTVIIDRSTLPSPVRSEGEQRITVHGVAAHLLGRMRGRHYREDEARRAALLEADPEFRNHVTYQFEDGQTVDRGEYRPGDAVGMAGVERGMEQALRGLRGIKLTHLDSNQTDRIDPISGRDVTLTIDIDLQAHVQAAMSPEFGLATVQAWHGERDDRSDPRFGLKEGDPLNGAAVVMDIATGEILAMVSTPSYTISDLRTRFDEMNTDEINTPLINRAINKVYAPGSIAKALMLPVAVTHGNYRLDERLSCTGHLLADNTERLRCWIYKRYNMTHDDRLGRELSGSDALMVSCNIFFFRLGRRMGPEAVVQAYRDFGLGRGFGLNIGPEFRGYDAFIDPELDHIQMEEAILMTIGQGPVAWTPMHATNALATLARGGVWLPPKIVLDPASKPEPGLEARDLGLDRAAIRETLDGLALSVNSRDGTGHHLATTLGQEPHFNVADRGVKLWGKTGTADASPIRPEIDGVKTFVRDGDHSWFVVLAGDAGGEPKYVVTVVMDFAGSGGKVSGPITNQILHKMVDLGYLGSETAAAR